MINGLPIDKMLADVKLVEEWLGSDTVALPIIRDILCHVKALADDVERLQAGLGAIGQIVHGSTRVTRAIAEKTLGGGDPRTLEFFEEL